VDWTSGQVCVQLYYIPPSLACSATAMVGRVRTVVLMTAKVPPLAAVTANVMLGLGVYTRRRVPAPLTPGCMFSSEIGYIASTIPAVISWCLVTIRPPRVAATPGCVSVVAWTYWLSSFTASRFTAKEREREATTPAVHDAARAAVLAALQAAVLDGAGLHEHAAGSVAEDGDAPPGTRPDVEVVVAVA
jgi:hypothetical protein